MSCRRNAMAAAQNVIRESSSSDQYIRAAWTLVDRAACDSQDEVDALFANVELTAR
jgi:hypothetical protein